MAYGDDYDRTDPLSIESYGQRLIGKTFRDLCGQEDAGSCGEEPDSYGARHADRKRKGGLGELIEERHFHYPSNHDARPDFPEAGVELKATPYKKNKNGTLSAKERLSITMIDYFEVVEEAFESSHLWSKARLILLVCYRYQKETTNRLDYRIDYVKLFSPPEQDRRIIQHDFEVIVGKIKEGKAHELSEGDTLYLGAAPKASTSKARRRQPFSEELAKPRAFAYKNSYMTYVLNHYIIPDAVSYEPIMKGAAADSFENYVVSRIENYRDWSVQELCEEFHIKHGKLPKNLGAVLAYHILGIRGNQAEEFVKANIVNKTIRIEKNGKIKESMSFPAFRFKELVKEEWEDSIFGNYLRETRFFFIVYRYDLEGALRLKGCQFWNMPYEDLEGHVRIVWERTKKALLAGLKVTRENGHYRDNFPKASEDPVCHVRPHARDADDVYELPGGGVYPKQCFWLKNSYIRSQLRPNLLE